MDKWKNQWTLIYKPNWKHSQNFTPLHPYNFRSSHPILITLCLIIRVDIGRWMKNAGQTDQI